MKQLMIIWLILCIYNLTGCGGGGGNGGGRPPVPPPQADCNDASTVCCADDVYKVSNGYLTVCVPPNYDVVYDGRELYIEVKP